MTQKGGSSPGSRATRPGPKTSASWARAHKCLHTGSEGPRLWKLILHFKSDGSSFVVVVVAAAAAVVVVVAVGQDAPWTDASQNSRQQLVGGQEEREVPRSCYTLEVATAHRQAAGKPGVVATLMFWWGNKIL